MELIKDYFRALTDMGGFIYEHPFLSLLILLTIFLFFSIINPFSGSGDKKQENEINELNRDLSNSYRKIIELCEQNGSLRKKITKLEKRKPIILIEVIKEEEE